MSHTKCGAVGVAAVLLGVALAGCGGGGAVRSAYVDHIPLPADTMTFVADEIGRYGGRFVIGATSGPKTLNPVMGNESSSTDVMNLLFTSLADYDNGRQVDLPVFAKRWDVSADGLTWTFHLRHGACFSDGHPMTSEDVTFSFAVAADSSLHSPLRDVLTVGERMLEISAPDPYTVVVKSPEVSAVLLAAIGSIRILPRHVLEPRWKAGEFASSYSAAIAPESLVTSGPWRLKSQTPGEKVVLERNPYWFGVDAAGHRLPYLDELVFLIVPDQNTASLKFQAGEIDGLDNVKPEDYTSYEKGQQAGHYKLYDLGPSLNTNCLWFNLARVRVAARGRKVGAPVVDPVRYAWFSDARFRRAVSCAIDRDGLIRSVLFGFGVKNWSLQTPGNKQWYDPSVVGPDHDPDTSRRLLAEMGLKDRNGDGVLEDSGGHPVSFTLKTNADNNVRVQMTNFIKDDLAKVGVRVVPAPVEFRALVNNVREDHQYEAALLGFSTAIPPDPGMSGNVYRSAGATHWWNSMQPRPETEAEARIDELFARNVGTLDVAERHRTAAEIGRIWNEQALTVWLPSVVMKLPVSDRFGNVHPTPIPHRLLWNIDRVYVKPPARGA